MRIVRPSSATLSRLARVRPTLIVALAALVSTVALCANRVHNGDVYLQLASGRYVAEHGFVVLDPFPTLAHGRPWENQQWLSELAFYGVTRIAGLTGLTILYAGLLAAPLLVLLRYCRRKSAPIQIACVVLYLPALFGILHPRAAAFSLLGFALVAALAGLSGGRRAAIPLVFLVWANLHAGYPSGLALLLLLALGAAIDRRRGLAGHPPLAALTGVSALATLVTPLGASLFSYFLSFQNPAIAEASKEWQSALGSPPAIAYLTGVAAFATWLWRRMPEPRPLTPLIVSGAFVLAAAASLRNIIFVGPAIVLHVALCAPDLTADRARAASRRPALAVAAAATAGALVWGLALGPARTPSFLRADLVGYALDHPPRRGRIAAVAGVGSYLLWRAPSTPVVLDGWLEHFAPAELRGTYRLLSGHPDASAYIERWHIGAVITGQPGAVAALEARGFVAARTTPDGTYLVRRE